MAERSPAPPAPAANYGAAIRLARHAVSRLEAARDRSMVGVDVGPQLRAIASELREVAELLEPAPQQGRLL